MAGGFVAKAAALRFLSGRPQVELAGGAVRLVLTENAGAFLGLGASLPDAARRAIFVGAMAAILAGALAWLLLAAGTLSPVRSLAAGLMLGGGIGNFVDRLPDGLVTDYAVVSLGPLRTGVFNVPDMAILAGALLWIAGGFRRGYSGGVSKGGTG